MTLRPANISSSFPCTLLLLDSRRRLRAAPPLTPRVSKDRDRSQSMRPDQANVRSRQGWICARVRNSWLQGGNSLSRTDCDYVRRCIAGEDGDYGARVRRLIDLAKSDLDTPLKDDLDNPLPSHGPDRYFWSKAGQYKYWPEERPALGKDHTSNVPDSFHRLQ